MLQSHANLVAGNSGYVVWFNDIFESSLTTQTSSSSVQMDANRIAENCPRKVAILNEGAGDAVALLGKTYGFSYKALYLCLHVYIFPCPFEDKFFSCNDLMWVG